MAVRHFRAPRRSPSTWSGQSRSSVGVVERVSQQSADTGGEVQGGVQYPVGHPLHKGVKQHQRLEQCLPDPVQMSNLFGILGQLGGLEIPINSQ